MRIGGGFSWEWSNGNELWDLEVVRNLFARCGSSSCLVSTAAVGQQIVDREEGVFYVKKKWMWDDACSKVLVGRVFVTLGVKSAEKARESSGRDAAAGVVLGGDRPKVMLAPVEELKAETEDWIWDTGAALDVASAAVAGKRGFPDFECRWRCELCRVCCGRQWPRLATR